MEQRCKTDAKYKDLCCGPNHMCVKDEQNQVFMRGWNHFGQIGRSSAHTFVDVLCKVTEIKHMIASLHLGESHSILMTVGNDLYVFGSNAHGECLVFEGNLRTVTSRFLS